MDGPEVTVRDPVAGTISADAGALGERQQRLLVELLRRVHDGSAFYRRKFDAAGLDLPALRFPRDLALLPLTSKAELIADQAEHGPWGSRLTEPIERYTR